MRLFVCCSLTIALLACNAGNDTSGQDTDGDTDGVATGCITVDDEGSFGLIQDAVDAASDGATLRLCAGTYEEEVTITRPISIVGEDGAVWTAPTNTAPVNISGDIDVALSDLQVESTRSGIVITGGRLVLDHVNFGAIGNFAVKAADAEVTASDLTIDAPGDGGLEIDGGTLDLSTSVITAANGYGVTLKDGAVGTLTENAISGTILTTNEAFDGWAVHADDAIAILNANVFTGNFLGDVLVESAGELSMTGDTLSGSYVGVWLKASNASLSDVSITDYQQYGVVDEGGQTLQIAGATIVTTEELAQPQTSSDDFSGAFGVIGLGTDMTISDTTVSGNTGAGVYQSPGNDTGVILNISNTQVTDNARWGIIAFSSTMTLTDVNVTGTRDDDDTCYDDMGYIVCNMAVAPWESDLSWTGGELSGNGTFGLAPIFADVEVSGVTFSNNTGSGVWAHESTFGCDQCIFDQSRAAGLYMQESSVGVLTNSTFQNNGDTSMYTYVDEETGDITETYSYYNGRDIEVSDSHLAITDSDFSAGDMGIYSIFSDLDVNNCSFTDYNSDVIYMYYNDTGSSRIANTTFDNIGTSPVYCASATLELNQISITGVTAENYKYESYLNGVLDYSYETTFNGYGISVSNCTTEVKNSSLDDIRGRALIAANSPIEIDDVSVTNALQVGSSTDAAVHLTYSTIGADVEITDLEVDGVTVGNALAITGSATYPGVQVALSGLSFGETTDIAGSGALLSTLGTASITGIHFQNIGLHGISTTSTALTIDGVDEDRDGQIVAPGGHGIYAVNSAISATNVHVTNPGLSGFNVGVGEHNLTNNTVTDATRYGFECDPAATFLACAGNTLAGLMGELLECGACSGEDTDVGDTDVADTDTAVGP